MTNIEVEFLLIADNESLKCENVAALKHLLQSNSEINILRNKITHKKFTAELKILSGKVNETNNTYFHLIFSSSQLDKVEHFSNLLRAVRAILHIANRSPQILYDGISLFYSKEAYPKIFEIENIMRKLITKFMLVNVGIEWIKERVPEDVRATVRGDNKELTYLHNIDFIQLKNFLFSENFPAHKESLVNKMRKIKDVSEIDLTELKSIIPISNWDKYFSDKVNFTKETLSKKWDELYDLRCKVAHTKSFTKSDLEKVNSLCSELKPILNKALIELTKINISEQEVNILTEAVATNFSKSYGLFLSEYNKLMKTIFDLTTTNIFDKDPSLKKDKRKFHIDCNLLFGRKIITKEIFQDIKSLIDVRNHITHNTDTLTDAEMEFYINLVRHVLFSIKNK